MMLLHQKIKITHQDNIISVIKNYPVFTDFYEIYGNDIKQVIDSEIKFTATDFKIGKIFKADKEGSVAYKRVLFNLFKNKKLFSFIKT